MKTNQFMVAGIIGSTVHFLLGWLVYGVVLMETMQAHTNQSLFKKDDEMVFWSIMIGSLCLGFLLTFILNKAKVTDAKVGMGLSAVVGLLMAAYMNFTSFGTSNVYSDLTAVLVDTLAGGFIAGVTGFAIAWYLGKSATK